MRLCFFPAVLMFLYSSAINYAQQDYSYELSKIEFEGNKEISTNELKSVIFSEETPWWFYKFLNSFTSLGKPPVYFDSSNIQIDLQAAMDMTAEAHLGVFGRIGDARLAALQRRRDLGLVVADRGNDPDAGDDDPAHVYAALSSVKRPTRNLVAS